MRNDILRQCVAVNSTSCAHIPHSINYNVSKTLFLTVFQNNLPKKVRIRTTSALNRTMRNEGATALPTRNSYHTKHSRRHTAHT